ncbi:O-methyltransferase [Saccharothrix sp. NRRL B-16314]|uniref:O-methyltransferase n=1 Tax=Saccharothrix sp. NRRL B-16314 TaxID=1463825 RepID=UPI0005247A73|nr:class I SAM-dependent methyltransferase [Saccharothrix sp. NRRL B-16314]
MADQLLVSDDLMAYVRRVSLREDAVLRELRETTAELPGGLKYLVMPEEGQLLALLAALSGTRRIVEVGTFTGYAALCMARALPPDGTLITCDITARWSSIAVEHWKRADVADRIDFRTGDGRAVLADLLAELGPGSVDMAFIDADKAGYRDYYEGVLRLLRPGGLAVIDNTLLFGRVADPTAQDADTAAVHELNESLRDDDRVDIAVLPMADGVTLARKR